jgi:shikimate dehydrogenase
VGQHPDTSSRPDIPYEGIGKQHILMDLIYNPETTAFMQAGLDQGAAVLNGLRMLHGQAEAAWDIWNR